MNCYVGVQAQVGLRRQSQARDNVEETNGHPEAQAIACRTKAMSLRIFYLAELDAEFITLKMDL